MPNTYTVTEIEAITDVFDAPTFEADVNTAAADPAIAPSLAAAGIVFGTFEIAPALIIYTDSPSLVPTIYTETTTITATTATTEDPDSSVSGISAVLAILVAVFMF